MTHNELAGIVMSAIMQERKNVSPVYASFLMQDFDSWDNGGRPTQGLLSAVNQYVGGGQHTIPKILEASRMLHNQHKAS